MSTDGAPPLTPVASGGPPLSAIVHLVSLVRTDVARPPYRHLFIAHLRSADMCKGQVPRPHPRLVLRLLIPFDAIEGFLSPQCRDDRMRMWENACLSVVAPHKELGTARVVLALPRISKLRLGRIRRSGHINASFTTIRRRVDWWSLRWNSISGGPSYLEVLLSYSTTI